MVKYNRSLRSSKKMDRLQEKNLSPTKNPGSFRHFKSFNRERYGNTKSGYGDRYWKTVEDGVNFAEDLLKNFYNNGMTQQDFQIEVHNYCSKNGGSVKIPYILRRLSDEGWGWYQNLPTELYVDNPMKPN